MPERTVALELAIQYLCQSTLPVPTSEITEGEAVQLYQFTQRLFEDGFELLKIRLPEAVYLLASGDYLGLPGGQERTFDSTTSQQRIPLFETLLQPLPR